MTNQRPLQQPASARSKLTAGLAELSTVDFKQLQSRWQEAAIPYQPAFAVVGGRLSHAGGRLGRTSRIPVDAWRTWLATQGVIA
jgi:hypothetical protein